MNQHVSFQERLDMGPFMSEKQTAMYTLVGVLVHSGHTCNSGHYYSYVKSSDGHWYCMNDCEVTKVSVKTVLQQSAYMLFYIKDGTSKKLKEKPILKQNQGNSNDKKGLLASLGVKENDPKLTAPVQLNAKETTKTVARETNLAVPVQSDIKKDEKENQNPRSLLLDMRDDESNGSNQSSSNSTSSWIVDWLYPKKKDITAVGSVVDTVISNVDLQSKGIKKVEDTMTKTEKVQITEKKHITNEYTKKSYEVGQVIENKGSVAERWDPNTPKQPLAWNHLATSDLVYERNQLLGNLDRMDKRKRPSRDDILYDQPLCKSKKSKQDKMKRF